MSSKALYTINFGEYNPLREPEVITPGWDYIVFTNNDLESDVFKVIRVESNLPDRLAARDYYINSNKYLDYDTTIMIGSQIQCNTNLDEFCDKNHMADISLMKHPARDCIYNEALELKKWFGEAGGEMIDLQMKRYKERGMPRNLGLFAHGIIIRNKSENVARHEELWWDEVSNPEYVARDQLSFMYILWKHNLVTTHGFGDYWDILHNEFPIFKHGTHDKL